jgi:hypothetical protein
LHVDWVEEPWYFPDGHAGHEGALASDHFPLGQLSQPDEDGPLYFPLGQLLQEPALA